MPNKLHFAQESRSAAGGLLPGYDFAETCAAALDSSPQLSGATETPSEHAFLKLSRPLKLNAVVNVGAASARRTRRSPERLPRQENGDEERSWAPDGAGVRRAEAAPTFTLTRLRHNLRGIHFAPVFLSKADASERA